MVEQDIRRSLLIPRRRKLSQAGDQLEVITYAYFDIEPPSNPPHVDWRYRIPGRVQLAFILEAGRALMGRPRAPRRPQAPQIAGLGPTVTILAQDVHLPARQCGPLSFEGQPRNSGWPAAPLCAARTGLCETSRRGFPRSSSASLRADRVIPVPISGLLAGCLRSRRAGPVGVTLVIPRRERLEGTCTPPD